MGYAAVNSEKKRFRAFMNKNPSKAQVIARIKKIMSGKGEKSALKFEVMKFGLENYFGYGFGPNRGNQRLEGIHEKMFNLQDNLYPKLGFYDIREGEMRGSFDIPQDKIDDFVRNTKQYLSPKKKKAAPPSPSPPPTRKRKPAAKKTGKEKTKAAKEKARDKAAKEKARDKAAKEKARAKAKAVKEKAKAKAAKEKEKASAKAKANAAKKKYEKDRVKFFAAKKKAMAKAKAKAKANAERRIKCLKPFRLAFKQFLKAKNKYKKCSGLSENNSNDEIYKASNQIY